MTAWCPGHLIICVCLTCQMHGPNCHDTSPLSSDTRQGISMGLLMGDDSVGASAKDFLGFMFYQSGESSPGIHVGFSALWGTMGKLGEWEVRKMTCMDVVIEIM